MTTDHLLDTIRVWDSALAPDSETALLGAALDAARSTTNPDAELAYWTGAYSLLAWATDYPDRWERLYGDVWESPAEMILGSGEDWTGWAIPAQPPQDLVAWRAAEGLSQTRAAELAGVDLRSWQRWESGERGIPQWLADTLRQRWGTAP